MSATPEVDDIEELPPMEEASLQPRRQRKALGDLGNLSPREVATYASDSKSSRPNRRENASSSGTKMRAYALSPRPKLMMGLDASSPRHLSPREVAAHASDSKSSRPKTLENASSSRTKMLADALSPRPISSPRPEQTMKKRPTKSEKKNGRQPEIVHEFGCKRGLNRRIRSKVGLPYTKVGMKVPVKRMTMLFRRKEKKGQVEKVLRPYIKIRSKKNPLTHDDEEAFMSSLVWYGSWFQVLRETGVEDDNMKKEKKIATEACMRYIDQIIESQGFDSEGLPFLSVRPQIVPRVLPFRTTDTEWLPGLCNRALAKFNSFNGTCFKFDKVVKANRIISWGEVIFATFEATMAGSESPVTFQTRGFHSSLYPEHNSIDFCRIKKDTSGGSMYKKPDVDDAQRVVTTA